MSPTSSSTAAPLDPAEVSVRKQEDIVAALCAEAPSEAVRNCLRKYEPRKPAWQIEAAFKKVRKQTLVDTLFYLKVPQMDQYKVDILPRELFCRVQNLFPDVCHLCQQEYCVTLKDNPIIHCASCGQGCHDHCLLQLLGITPDDLSEENEHGIKLLNPHASIGLIYLCGPCQKEVIPQKEKIKTKATQRTSNRQATNVDSTTQSQTQDHNTQPPPSNDGESETTSGINGEGDQEDNSDQPDHSDAQGQGSLGLNDSLTADPLTTNSQPAHRQRQQRRHPPTTVQSMGGPQSVCKYYKQGRCRYGISGKKDGDCPYSHPKACQRFLTNGSNGRRGCSKNDCQLFHPNICNSSMKDRTCFRVNCKYLHLKGTKRSRESEVEATRSPSPLIPQNTPPSSSQRPNQDRPSPPASSSEQNHNHTFLDQVKAINLQMKEMTNKLYQMEANYSSLQFQLQTMSHQQPKLLQPQLSMLPPGFPQYQMPVPQVGPGTTLSVSQ